MKKILLACSILLFGNIIYAQTSVFSEDFDNNSGTGSNWDILDEAIGGQGDIPSEWWISDMEAGTAVGTCGSSGGGDQTLHVSTCACYNGDVGAAYEIGSGLCYLIPGICPVADKRTYSNTIVTTGVTGMTLTFQYMEGGEGLIDDATVIYSINDGVTWIELDNPAKTLPICPSNGVWTAYAFPLPVSCENITTLRIGFRWVNNDGGGVDPSFAVDDIDISGNVPPPCTDPDVPSALTSTQSSICPGASSTLSWTGSLNDATNWHVYTTSCGVTQLTTTASNSLVVTPGATTTYYIRGEDGAGCVDESTGTCGSVTVTVDKTASTITSATASTNNVCANTSVNVTANGVSAGSGATLTWYTGTGGTGSNLGGSNPLNVSPATTTTYYARLAGTCNTVETSITVTVDKTASSITSATASTNNVCASTSVDLTANGVSAGSGSTLTWYTGTGGTGANLGTVNPLSVSPATTTTYYARLAGTCNTVETSITVTVLPAIDTSTTTNAFDITSNQTGATYQWINCNNGNTVIAGETDITYSATANGDYAVIVTMGSCSDTSACVSLNNVGINESSFGKNIQLFPNPTTNYLTLKIEEAYKSASYQLIDLQGKVIKSNKVDGDETTIKMEGLPTSIYFLSISDNNQLIKTFKIIKN